KQGILRVSGPLLPDVLLVGLRASPGLRLAYIRRITFCKCCFRQLALRWLWRSGVMRGNGV
ncbi:hypothetical protein ACQUKK_25620, partial [Ralstonia pseudosolanacearum]